MNPLPPSLLLTGLRDLLRRPWQSSLMLLGVALGVSMVVAIDLANESARRAFRLSSEAVVGRTTHQLVGGPSGVPEDVYRWLRVERGLRASAPVVEGVGLAVDHQSEPVRILGIDLIAEAPFRSNIPWSSVELDELAKFYVEPNVLLVPVALAERFGLQPGDELRLQVNDRVTSLRVLGISDPGEAASRQSLDGLVWMDVAAAQELLGLSGGLTRIDLILTPVEADTLAAALPAGLRLEPAAVRTSAVESLSSAFHLNLTALSLLALIVGAFLIYNTVTFSVVQRRAVFGMLHALGATNVQLFLLLVIEAAAVAALGAGLGLIGGWALGQGMVRLVTRTINDLYFVLAVRDAPLPLATIVKGGLLGVGAGALAAVGPAWEAVRVAPVAAMQRSVLEARAQSHAPLLAAVGLILTALGAATLGAWPQSLGAGFAGLLCIVLGLSLCVPVVAVGWMRLSEFALGRLAGPLGAMAARSVRRSLSRTGVAIAALAVAVSVSVGMSLMVSSFRDTVVRWLDLTVRADLYVSAPSVGGARPMATLSSDVPARVEAVPGVAAVERYRSVVASSEFGDVLLSVVDAQRERDQELYRIAEGTPAEIWAQVKDGAVLVSESFAYRHRLPERGATVTLHTDDGPQAFPVAGVVYDYASDRGIVLLAEETYQRHWRDREVTSLGIMVESGVSIEAVAQRVRAALAGTAAQVRDNRAIRDGGIAVFDRTFAVTEALRWLAVLVAFVAVLSAVLSQQLERTREWATLQALGFTPRLVARQVVTETGLIGLLAGLCAIPMGNLVARVLVDVVNLRSFGWAIELRPDAWLPLQAVGLSLAAAWLAGLYPLRRLQQMPIAAALRQE